MNPYKVLQVDRDAEPEVIEAAYRRLVAKYHPDRNPAAEATAMMRDINAAYAILCDPERRESYDRSTFAADSPFSPGSFRPPAPQAAEAYNSIVRNVLVVGGLLTLLVYRPVVGAVLAAASALVWLAWSKPGPTGKFLKGAAIAVVLVVLGFGVDLWLKDRMASEELEGLTVAGLFADKLAQAEQQCLKSAPGPKARASAYCACLSQATRERFDASPVHVDTAVDYRHAVDVRFQAASPTEDAQAACRTSSLGAGPR